MEKSLATYLIAPALVLLVLLACATPCRAELNFSSDARVSVLDYPTGELARQAAIEKAGTSAMLKTLKYLKKNFMVRKTGMDKKELAKLIKYHFPGQVVEAKQLMTGRGPTAMARVKIPIEIRHFQESVRLWAHSGGAYLDTPPGSVRPGSGFSLAQQSTQMAAPPVDNLQRATTVAPAPVDAPALTLSGSAPTAPAPAPAAGAPAVPEQPAAAPAAPAAPAVPDARVAAQTAPAPQTVATNQAMAASAARHAAQTKPHRPATPEPLGAPGEPIAPPMTLEPPATMPTASTMTTVAQAAPASTSPYMPRITDLSQTGGYGDLDAPIVENLDAPAVDALQNKSPEEMTSQELVRTTALLWEGGSYTDPDMALELTDRALIRTPDAAVPHNNKGAALHDLGRYKEAVAEYTLAVENDPLFAEAFNNRGFSRHFLGQYETAVQDYTKALEIDGNNAQAYLNRGFAYRELQRVTDMCEDFTSACSLGECAIIEAARAQQACP